MPTLVELLARLRPDPLRAAKPFSEEMAVAHKILWNPYAQQDEVDLIMRRWLQRHQPCVFGSIAAVEDRIHMCVVHHDYILKGDDFVRDYIEDHLLEWRRRSFHPGDDVPNPAYGFLLLVASQQVAEAAPDENLYAFSEALLELWCSISTKEAAGKVYWQYLYLESPGRDVIKRFTFSVDYFAAQGDGRWWHDHRVPGGIAYTANSVGHMMWHRTWYRGLPEQSHWIVATAMTTINRSAKTDFGHATWLREIGESGTPFIHALGRPIPIDQLPTQLRDKDWTRYLGYLHTDQSVRREFFEVGADVPGWRKGHPYLEDFTYLYDAKSRDNARFVAGEEMPCHKVMAELGDPADWPHTRIKRAFGAGEAERTVEQEATIAAVLTQSMGWELSVDEYNKMSGPS